jgi:hypothetical protein
MKSGTESWLAYHTALYKGQNHCDHFTFPVYFYAPTYISIARSHEYLIYKNSPNISDANLADATDQKVPSSFQHTVPELHVLPTYLGTITQSKKAEQ